MRFLLLDTNVLLDIALKRQPFYEDALRLLDLMDSGHVTGHVTATTVTDIYYVARRHSSHKEAIEFIMDMTAIVEVLGVDKETILHALANEHGDLEDAVQSSAALMHRMDVIITRNTGDFRASEIPAMHPKDFLRTIG